MSQAMIKIVGLSAELGDASAGQDAFKLLVPEFGLKQSERIMVTGSSGAGKTLFLQVLGLLKRPKRENGERTYTLGWCNGDCVQSSPWDDYHESDLDALRGQTFGFIPQTGGLLPFLSVEENIALPQVLAGRRCPKTVEELISYLKLKDQRGKYPSQLSVGQSQRVAIARAISHKPRFVIADEPTSALDRDLSKIVVSRLHDISKMQCFGKPGVILSTHDEECKSYFNPIRCYKLQAYVDDEYSGTSHELKEE